MMEFINMGLIVMVFGLNMFDGLNNWLLKWTGIDFSSHYGFTPDWYRDIGEKICFFIFLSSLVSNLIDFLRYLKASFWRFYDRRFKMNVKLDPEDEDDDEPNTRKKSQTNLESLYTGREFKGELAYSRMMSILFVVVFYSSGMPLLYGLAFLFYFLTYSFNKFLILKFYRKSFNFTRAVPQFSNRFLQASLILHLFGALFMLTEPLPFLTQ